jgi:hypothetical protein
MGADELASWLTGIDETVCGDFATACDSSGLDECATVDVAVDCVDFTCQAI